MASSQTEWAIKLAQQLATLPQQIEEAAAARDKAVAALAVLEAEISEAALTFPMFEKADKEGAVRRVGQASEWQYKVAVDHLRANHYGYALDGEEPMPRANHEYAEALAALNSAINVHNRLVREWDSIDKILSIFKRAL